MLKRALLVGIDDYPDAPLAGCVSDARRVADLISANYDGSPGFDCRVFTSDEAEVTRAGLREAIQQLLDGEVDVALFFFAGHGTHNNLGGHLVTQDAARYEEGVSMMDLLTLANRSKAREVVVILDCCHSGAFGVAPAIETNTEHALLRQGMSILAASRAAEAAAESAGGGVFTSLVCDALAGGGADVCGKVTAASIYAYADEALGAWEQRPLFKANVSCLRPLRMAKPAVPVEILRLLPRYFTAATSTHQLDPSYEPTCDTADRDRVKVFRHLQQYRDANLVVPVGVDHFYDAAMQSMSCQLTPLGRHYWALANRGVL